MEGRIVLDSTPRWAVLRTRNVLELRFWAPNRGFAHTIVNPCKSLVSSSSVNSRLSRRCTLGKCPSIPSFSRTSAWCSSVFVTLRFGPRSLEGVGAADGGATAIAASTSSWWSASEVSSDPMASFLYSFGKQVRNLDGRGKHEQKVEGGGAWGRHTDLSSQRMIVH